MSLRSWILILFIAVGLSGACSDDESTADAGHDHDGGDGDGDGDGDTGDGDGDGDTGDGDGDGDTSDAGDGDGDGDTSDAGDGDGDGDTSDAGDGDASDAGDNDGSTADGGDGDCTNYIRVEIDGEERESCVAELAAGGLNHVSGVLDDGTLLIVNFTGQVVAEDVCVGFGVREPGNDTTMNDWMANMNACDVDVTAYGASGERVQGTFSGTANAVGGPGDDLEITHGSFDVERP